MSEIWNFTPSLESQVQLCISSASKNENNKWLRHFRHVKFDKVLNKKEEKNCNASCEKLNKINSPILLSDEEDCIEDVNVENHVKSGDIDNENLEALNELLETDITLRVDFIIEESLKKSRFLKELALQLPTASIEKLCKYIYDCNNINRQFLDAFFKYFLPTFIKRDYNCFTFDLLLKGSKIYPKEFDISLSAIIKDLEIPSKVLHDYILSLGETEKTKFLLILCDIDLSQEELSHNIFSIYTAYKDCVKTEQIQNYIQSIVNKYHSYFTAERNFGRLLLNFLQSQKDYKEFKDYPSLEKIIESHRSPFKRPCLNILNELKDSQGGKNLKQFEQKKAISEIDTDGVY